VSTYGQMQLLLICMASIIKRFDADVFIFKVRRAVVVGTIRMSRTAIVIVSVCAAPRSELFGYSAEPGHKQPALLGPKQALSLGQ
jgi:hypothetical protein